MLDFVKKNILYLLFFLLFAVYAFNEFYLKSFSRYDSSWNINRIELKIPIIELYWNDMDKRKNFWLDTNHIHYSKMLLIKPNFVNFELDSYSLKDNKDLQIINKYNRITNKLISTEYKLKDKKTGLTKIIEPYSF